jgi:Leucine-rich repeat (LRR) protein
MTSLETVDISNNLVSDIKCLGGLTNLRYLYIGGNPIPEEDIMYLRDMLPNCIIYTN